MFAGITISRTIWLQMTTMVWLRFVHLSRLVDFLVYGTRFFFGMNVDEVNACGNCHISGIIAGDFC